VFGIEDERTVVESDYPTVVLYVACRLLPSFSIELTLI
jgi:hypothetical protein